MIELKRCTTCEKDLEGTETNFRKQSRNKDGLKYTCRKCDDERAKKRYRDNAEKLIANQVDYNKKNKTRYKNYQREYHKARREVIKFKAEKTQ